MPLCSNIKYPSRGDDSEMDKTTHQWKDGHIRLLEKRLNRERTNIRLVRDVNKDLEAKVDAQTETIKRLQTELKSIQEELAELSRCTTKKDSQLETFSVLVEQQERDCLNLKHKYNLQLDSITKSLQENQQHVISELKEQVKRQKEELSAKDDTITKLKFSKEVLEIEKTLASDSLKRLKSSLGISNIKAQPKLKNQYYKKQTLRQESLDVLFSKQSMAKLDSIASESLQRVNNNNGHWKPVVHPRTPVTINDENITPQRSNAKDGSQRHQVDDKNTVQAIIPRKRPLHAISTNECFIISKRASWIKKEVFRSINANVNDTCLPNTRLDEQNDPIVAVKKEEDLDSHTIDLSLPSDSAHIDDFTLKNETINDQSIKKNDNKSNTATSSRDDSRSIGQGPITPSSSGTIINNHQQSINRLPVSAGHQHHRAHMTGETCIACANFYGNDSIVANVNGEQVRVTSNDRIQAHSRHRRTKRATTPPGFWEMEFASPPEDNRSRRYFQAKEKK